VRLLSAAGAAFHEARRAVDTGQCL
jgi:hypothetical protein